MKKISISNKLKIVSITLAIIVAFAVSPTLAYLSATSDPVVNYFSGGAIAIKLDEAPVDTDGKATDGDRVQENHYKYIAGAELDKDPTVTVLANSEDCYVYVCVDNELPDDLFSININTGVWKLVATSGTMTIYRYVDVVESVESDQALIPVFTKVMVSESLTSDDIADLGTKTLTVTAFAIQTASLSSGDADELAVVYFFEGVDVASLEGEVNAENAANTEAVQATGAAAEETVSGQVTAGTETTAGTVSTEETSGTETTEETASEEEAAETETTEETVPREETTETEAAQETASEEEAAETEAAQETASEEETAAGEAETGESEESVSGEETEQESGADDASGEAAAASGGEESGSVMGNESE